MGMIQNGHTNDFVIEELALKMNEKNLKQWENYALKKENDLTPFDKAILELMAQIRFDDFPGGRKKEVLHRKYLMERVENDPQISKLKHTLEVDIFKIKTADLSRTQKEKACIDLKKRVLELMKTRNEKAKENGFQSYPQLAFHFHEVDLIESEKMIRSFLKNNLARAKEMLQHHHFSWELWSESLYQIGKDAPCEVISEDVIDFISDHTDFSSFRKHLRVDVVEKGVSGIVFPINGSKDIRIVLREDASLSGISTLLHEMGHALAYYSLPEDPVFSWLSPFFDECVATIFERIMRHQLIPEPAQSLIGQIRLLEAVRCSISFLFEMDLWEGMNEPERLFESYQRLLGIKNMPSSLWVLDTFRSVDPVYVHTYVLGEIYGSVIDQKIQHHPTILDKDILPFVIHHLVIGGARTPFMDRYHRLLKSL